MLKVAISRSLTAGIPCTPGHKTSPPSPKPLGASLRSCGGMLAVVWSGTYIQEDQMILQKIISHWSQTVMFVLAIHCRGTCDVKQHTLQPDITVMFVSKYRTLEDRRLAIGTNSRTQRSTHGLIYPCCYRLALLKTEQKIPVSVCLTTNHTILPGSSDPLRQKPVDIYIRKPCINFQPSRFISPVRNCLEHFEEHSW